MTLPRPKAEIVRDLDARIAQLDPVRGLRIEDFHPSLHEVYRSVERIGVDIDDAELRRLLRELAEAA